MADGDIQLRDNGTADGDISLTGGASVTPGFATITWTVFDATGNTNEPAFIYSVQPEVMVVFDAEQSKIYSVQPEVIVTFEGEPAKIYSVQPEIMVIFKAEPAKVYSLAVEVIPGRPLDDYSPYYPPGSGGAGLCVGFASPAPFQSDAPCCDGFAEPGCGTSGGGPAPDPVLLAFQKDADDTVLLCTRVLSGLLPTGGLSMMSWSRAASFETAGQIPVINAESSTRGWRLAYGGSGAPSNILSQYRDTGGTQRSDAYAFSGGTLLGAGWHAVGGFRNGLTPWPQRAFVDDEVGASTNGTVAPGSGGATVVTLFGEPSGPEYFLGLMLCPLMLMADLGSDGTTVWQDDFFDDLGKRESAIYTNPALMLAPRAMSDVIEDEPVRVWVVDENDAEVSGPVVWGTPSYWRGPWWGLNFEDIHWIEIPWVSSNLSTGRTLILSLQGSSVPGTAQYVTGRVSALAGGIELSILTTDGTDCTAAFYNAVGAQVATITLDVTEVLGDLVYYVVQIGAGGTAACTLSVYLNSGSIVSTSNSTPSGTVAINQAQGWGRTHSGNAYTAGTCFRYLEFAGILSDTQIRDYILQTNVPPTPVRDARGCSSNVWDDGDPVRLWGPYDATGAYASQIVFASIGTSEIVVGS